MDYNDILNLDTMSLDYEWQRQPMLYMQASEVASEEFQKLQSLKDYLNVKIAEIALDYRLGKRTKMGEDDKALKITDKALDAILGQEEELIAIRKEISEQKKVYDDASSVVSALEHKKKALENEVSLFILRMTLNSIGLLQEEGIRSSKLSLPLGKLPTRYSSESMISKKSILYSVDISR